MAIPSDEYISNENQNTPAPVISANINNEEINSEVINSEENQEIKLAMAGPAKVGSKISSKVADVLVPPSAKKRGESVQSGQPIATMDSGELRIRSANAEEMEKLKLFAEEAFKNPTRQEKKDLKVISPNLSRIESLDGNEKSLSSFVEATYNVFKDTIGIDKNKILEKGERGFEEIIKDANKIGSVDIFYHLMTRKKGDRIFTDAELLAARRTILSLQLHANTLLKKAEKTGDVLDMAKAAQAVSIQGYASIQLIKVQEDIGRALVTNKIIASPSSARVLGMSQMLESIDASAVTGQAIINESNIGNFLDAYGGEEGLRTFLSLYKRLPDDASKLLFAKRGLFKKTTDAFIEIFQSALLSNPITHTYNFMSQLAFQELLILERMLEGNAKEALAMFKAQITYLPQAFRAGWYALKNERTITDDASKLDVNVRAISKEAFGFQPNEEGKWSMAAHTVDGFGVMMRFLGYRPMLGIDEMFKAMGRGMEIEAIATRTKGEVYNSVMDVGQIPENYKGKAKTLHEYAVEQANEASLKAKHSQTTFDEASEFARMLTFQDDLPGILGQANGIMSNPLIKIWVPFYKTPTQVIRRIMERTPFAIAMPSVLRDQIINGSNATRRKAMAKIGLGSGFSATMMMLGSGLMDKNFVMTGYGPTNPKLRKTWLETHEPYSIGVRTDENSDWEWTSYKRYDPISGIVALAMDTSETFRWSNETQLLDDAFLNLALSSTRYVTTSLPMTQFLGELIDVAGSPFEDGQKKAERIRELLSKQLVQSGLVVGQQVGTVGLFGNSMSGTIERYVDPNARSAKPDERYYFIPSIGMQPEIRGAYEALNKIRSRIPILSEELPILVNRWNEPIMQGQGAGWETVAPYRVVKKPGGNVINNELRKIGLGFPNLPRNMSEPLVLLSGKQYKRYVELYNDPSVSEFAKILFDGKSNIPITAISAFEKTILGKTPDGMGGSIDIYNSTINENERKVPSNRKHKITVLRSINNQYKQIAKQLMLLEFPELRALVKQRDDYENEYGENPPMLFNPSESDLKGAMEYNKNLLKEFR